MRQTWVCRADGGNPAISGRGSIAFYPFIQRRFRVMKGGAMKTCVAQDRRPTNARIRHEPGAMPGGDEAQIDSSR